MNDNERNLTPEDTSKEDVFSLSDNDLDKLVADILAEASTDRDIREAQNILDSSATMDLSIWDTDDLPDIPNLRPMEDAGQNPPEKEGLTQEEIAEFSSYSTEPEPRKLPEKEELSALPEAGDAKEEPAPRGPSPRKRRPARKAGYGFLGIPQILTACVWIGLVLAVGISLGRILWVCAEDVLAFNRENQPVVVSISAEDDMETIAGKLHDAGLVRYPKLFGWYAQLSHAEDKISTGTFTLNTIYDYHALVAAMGSYSPAREIVTVTIPEGYNSYQIFRLLEAEGVCSREALGEVAANGDLGEYWFLEGVERGTPNCLEGFLFPDTYEFYTDDDADRVICKLLNGFDARFTDRMKDDFVSLRESMADRWRWNGYSEEYIEEHTLTIQELITIASLVEKEAASISESYTIASVFYNRLADLGSYPYLNSDAALYYIFAETGDHGELTQEDLQIDSPYNTYTHMGLPPTPIANPGRNSIYAALYPEDTDYYYFVYDPDIGGTHFSESLWEHENYIANME